ncbi:MAG: hypothetical protein ACREVC_12530 [Burkholderiales bacterium]
MHELQQALAGRKLGAPQAYRNLAVFTLAALGDAPAGYLLLDEALERRFARGRKRCGPAANWRDKFLRGPTLREHAIARGVMRDTVETAIPWSGFLALEAKVKAATLAAIRETTGRAGTCTVRFTHLYPDGPAPTFTWHAYGDKARLPEQFWATKAAAL